MVNRKLKKPVLYASYAVGLILLIGVIYMIERSLSNALFTPDDDIDYVTDTILDDDIPVVNVSDTIIRPYKDSGVKVIKGYYDYKADQGSQQNALIIHDNTYFQNSGVSYGGVPNFEVVAILDGTVINVRNDELLGKIIEVKHSNNMISVYQSLSEAVVEKDALVKQGQVIGKSGTSQFGRDLNDHLHFEIIHKGMSINPEEYYDKLVKDL